MGNKTGKLFFKIALSISLTGLLLYFIQEIIYWTRILPVGIMDQGFPITIVISDGFMIIGIILTIVWIFMGFEKMKILRAALMMGALYLLTYTFANLFAPFFGNSAWGIPVMFGNNIVNFYAFDGLSFILLLILGLVAIFTFIQLITKSGEEEITVAERFTLIIILVLIIISDLATINMPRYYLLGFSFWGYYGFFFLPMFLDAFLIALVVVLTTMTLTMKGSKAVSILGIVLLNLFLIGLISTVVSDTVLDFTASNNTVPFALGNSLLLLGTVLTAIASIQLVKNK